MTSISVDKITSVMYTSQPAIEYKYPTSKKSGSINLNSKLNALALTATTHI